MENKITGVLVDVLKQEIKKVTIDNTLEELYRILDCDSIDIVERTINGVNVRIVCDDCGFLKIKPIISIAFFPNEVIVGNTFICDFDGVDDLCSLSEDNIKHVLNSQALISNYRVLISTH